MVGPDIKGLGGISRVVQIWESSGLLFEHGIRYLPSVSEASHNKFLFTIHNLFKFALLLVRGCSSIYIHIGGYGSLLRKAGFILLARCLSKKVLLHIHPGDFFQVLSLERGLNRRFAFFVLKHIQAFIVLTEEMRRSFEFYFPNRKVFILTNPVDINNLKNTNGYKREKNRLLYMGWYIKEKGVFELVDAVYLLFQKNIEVYLDFYGTKQIEELKAYVKKAKLNKYISVNGWITGKDKLQALHTCTMLILPSHSEGVPNIVLEGMATKTPIVATAVGGLKEMLKDYENAFIVQTRNPNHLSVKIIECLQDESLRQKVAENAYHYVLEKHDIQLIKKTFSQILGEVLN